VDRAVLLERLLTREHELPELGPVVRVVEEVRLVGVLLDHRDSVGLADDEPVP
jgi:hypothetical protein